MPQILSAKTLFVVSLLVFFASLGTGIYYLSQRRIENNQDKALTLEQLSPNLAKNGDFSQVPKDSSSPPEGWEAYQTNKEISYSESISFEKVEEPEYTYVNDSSLLVTSKLKDLGFSQDIPKDITLPGFVQANVLVVSGGVKLIVLDKKGNEIESVEVGVKQFEEDETVSTEPTDLWQRLPIRLPVGSSPRKLIAVSTQDNSKYYITNVNVKGDNSDKLEAYYKDVLTYSKIEQYTYECKKEGNKTNESIDICLEQKTGKTKEEIDKVRDFKSKLYYKGKLISDEQDNSSDTPFDLKTEQDNKEINSNVLGIQIYPVKYIFYDYAYSDEFINQTRAYIEDSWTNSGINKSLDTDNSIIERYDPTIATECNYRKNDGTMFYFPDEWCESDEIFYIFSLISGRAGFSFKTGQIYIDCVEDVTLKDVQYVIKHETGHLFGAPDSDFIEIEGNNFFPEGNSKKGTEYDDIMYDLGLRVSDYTRGIINRTSGVGRVNKMDDQFQQPCIVFINKVNNQKISSGVYSLFWGIYGGPHEFGKISSLIESSPFDGVVTKRLRASYNPVAFFIVESEGRFYRGQFDLIDSTMANFRGELETKVYLEEIEEVDLLKPKILVLGLEDGMKFNDFSVLEDININNVNDSFYQFLNWKLEVEGKDGRTAIVYFGDDDPTGQNLSEEYNLPPEFDGYNGLLDLKLSAVFKIEEDESTVEINKEYKNLKFVDNKGFYVWEDLVTYNYWKGYGSHFCFIAQNSFYEGDFLLVPEVNGVILSEFEFFELGRGWPQTIWRAKEANFFVRHLENNHNNPNLLYLCADIPDSILTNLDYPLDFVFSQNDQTSNTVRIERSLFEEAEKIDSLPVIENIKPPWVIEYKEGDTLKIDFDFDINSDFLIDKVIYGFDTYDAFLEGQYKREVEPSVSNVTDSFVFGSEVADSVVNYFETSKSANSFLVVGVVAVSDEEIEPFTNGLDLKRYVRKFLGDDYDPTKFYYGLNSYVFLRQENYKHYCLNGYFHKTINDSELVNLEIKNYLISLKNVKTGETFEKEIDCTDSDRNDCSDLRNLVFYDYNLGNDEIDPEVIYEVSAEINYTYNSQTKQAQGILRGDQNARLRFNRTFNFNLDFDFDLREDKTDLVYDKCSFSTDVKLNNPFRKDVELELKSERNKARSLSDFDDSISRSVFRGNFLKIPRDYYAGDINCLMFNNDYYDLEVSIKIYDKYDPAVEPVYLKQTKALRCANHVCNDTYFDFGSTDSCDLILNAECKDISSHPPNYLANLDCPTGQACYLNSNGEKEDCTYPAYCKKSQSGEEKPTVCSDFDFVCTQPNLDNLPIINSVTYQDFHDAHMAYGMFILEGENFSFSSVDENLVCIKEFDNKCYEPQTTGRDSKHLSILLDYNVLADTIKDGNLDKLTFTVYRNNQESEESE